MSKYHPSFVRTVTAAAALTSNRFVTYAGAVPAAGASVLGVANSDAASGEDVPVIVRDTAIVEAGEEIALGAAVETSNTGKALTKDTGVTVGRALQAATGDGHKIEVMLLPN